MCAVLTAGTAADDKDIDTETNSTISPRADSDTPVEALTDSQLTARLYRRLTGSRPVSVDGKLPTLDDVRAVIATDFQTCDDLWQITAPKKAVSRSVARCCWHLSERTRSTQPCIPPGSLNRLPASAGVRAGMSPLSGGR